MHEVNDMKEVQCVIVRNNYLCQYTTYNYPFLSLTNHRHQSYLRIFDRMKSNYLAQLQELSVRHQFTPY